VALILTVTESATGGLLVALPYTRSKVVRVVVSCYNNDTSPSTITADTCTGLPTGVTKTYSSAVGKEIAAGATEYLILELSIADTASEATTSVTYQVTSGGSYSKAFDLILVGDNLNRNRHSFIGSVSGSKALMMDEFITLGQILNSSGFNIETYVNSNGDLEISAVVPPPRVTRYSEIIGNGSSTSFVITHNLGTKDVGVHFYQTSTPFAMMFTDWVHTSINSITVNFVDPPSSGAVTVIVLS